MAKFSGPYSRQTEMIDRIADAITGTDELEKPTGSRALDSLERLAVWVETHGGVLSPMDGDISKVVLYKSKAEWDAQRDLIGENGTIYIYSDYKTLTNESGKTVNIPGIKVGDGKTHLVDLPFANPSASEELADELSAKLNKNVSVEDSGKFLMVDTDGDIKPMSPPVVTQNELQTRLDGKVDAAQGASNAGNYLIVGHDGNVTTEAKDLASKEYTDSIVKISSQQPTEESNKLWIKTDADGSVTVPTTAELESALEEKVDKVDGKILTSNDFTDSLKERLDNIEDYAQRNVIESIKVNGSAVPPDGDKAVSITVPTQGSDIGLGNVENKSSADIRGELTSSDVTTALGYTPLSQQSLSSALDEKVNISQPTASSGDIMAVDSNGHIVAKTIDYATKSYADGIINVGSSEPADSQAKLWIDTSNTSEVSVPTLNDLDNVLTDKLSINQGAENAGKLLVIGSDGKIVAVTMQQFQDGDY